MSRFGRLILGKWLQFSIVAILQIQLDILYLLLEDASYNVTKLAPEQRRPNCFMLYAYRSKQ